MMVTISLVVDIYALNRKINIVVVIIEMKKMKQ